jgi:streptomycin 6-kinase
VLADDAQSGAAWAAVAGAAIGQLAVRRGWRVVGDLPGGMGGIVAAAVDPVGRDLVVKATYPPGDAAAEAAALRWFSPAGVAPQVVEATVLPYRGVDVPVVAMVRVWPGRPLGRLLVPAPLPTATLAATLAALADRAAGLPAREVPLHDFTHLAARRWRLRPARAALLRRVDLDPAETVGRAAALGGTLLASLGDGGRAIHGDLHPGNLLWRRGALLAAVDWRAAIGDPAYDVGFLAVTAACGPPPDPQLRALARAYDADPCRAAAWARALAPGFLTDVLAGARHRRRPPSSAVVDGLTALARRL